MLMFPCNTTQELLVVFLEPELSFIVYRDSTAFLKGDRWTEDPRKADRMSYVQALEKARNHQALIGMAIARDIKKMFKLL